MRAPDALPPSCGRLALGVALAVFCVSPALAQSTKPPAAKLDAVERQAEAERERAAKAAAEADAVRSEVERLRSELIGAARQVQTGESALARL